MQIERAQASRRTLASNRPINQLDRQLAIIAETAARGMLFATHPPTEHADYVRAQWAALNGLTPSEDEFSLVALAEGKARSARWDPAAQNWPARDHASFYKRNKRAAAVMTEPYGDHGQAELRAYAAAHGLAVHTPPNPKASTWYPGSTSCLVITRDDFGPVVWLPDQLTFTKTRT